jgi:hypothetical protein
MPRWPMAGLLAITVYVGHELVSLPEGWPYLGFIFARAATPAEVEQVPRCAYARLHFDIR